MPQGTSSSSLAGGASADASSLDAAKDVLDKACAVWMQLAARPRCEDANPPAEEGPLLEEYMGQDTLGMEVCQSLKEARANMGRGDGGSEFACLRQAESMLQLWSKLQVKQAHASRNKPHDPRGANVLGAQMHHTMRYYLAETVLLTHIAMYHRRVDGPYAAVQHLMKAVSGEHRLLDVAKELSADGLKKDDEEDSEDVALSVQAPQRDSPWVMACRLLAEARVNLSAMFVEMGQYPEALQHGLRAVSLMTRGLKVPDTCEGQHAGPDIEACVQYVSTHMFLSSCEVLVSSLRAVGSASEFLGGRTTAVDAYMAAVPVAEHLPESHPMRLGIDEALLSLRADVTPVTKLKGPARPKMQQLDRKALRRSLTVTDSSATSEDDLQTSDSDESDDLAPEGADSSQVTSNAANNENGGAAEGVSHIVMPRAGRRAGVLADTQALQVVQSMRQAAEGTLKQTDMKMMHIFRSLEFALVARYGDRHDIFRVLDSAGVGSLSRSSWIDAVSQLSIPGFSVQTLGKLFDLIVRSTGGFSSPAQSATGTPIFKEDDFIKFCKDQTKVWLCMKSHRNDTVVDVLEIIRMIRRSVKERFSTLREAFKSADHFTDYQISLMEFQAALRKWEIMGIAEADAAMLFHILDADSNGILDYAELAQFFEDGSDDGFVEKTEQLSEDVIALIRNFERRCLLRFGSLEQALSVMNVNPEDGIDQEEFTQALLRWNLKEEQIAEFWKALDAGCEGQLTVTKVRKLCHLAAGNDKDADASLPAVMRSSSTGMLHNQSAGAYSQFSKWCARDGRGATQSGGPAAKSMAASLELLRKKDRYTKLTDVEIYRGPGAERRQLLERHATYARSLKARKAALTRRAQARKPARPWSAGAVSSRNNNEPSTSDAAENAPHASKGRRPTAKGSDHVQNLRNLIDYARDNLEKKEDKQRDLSIFDSIRQRFSRVSFATSLGTVTDSSQKSAQVHVSMRASTISEWWETTSFSRRSSMESDIFGERSYERSHFSRQASFGTSEMSTEGGAPGDAETAEDHKNESVIQELFPTMIDEDRVQRVRQTLRNADMLQRWYVPSMATSTTSTPKEPRSPSATSRARGDVDDSVHLAGPVSGFQQTVAAELEDCMAEARKSISGSRAKLAAVSSRKPSAGATATRAARNTVHSAGNSSLAAVAGRPQSATKRVQSI